MVLRAALALLLSGGSATAANRSTNIAMAVALLDVAREHCAITVDATVETKLMKDFHEYDIAGLASILSGPLNAFYEDFLHEMRSGRAGFCKQSPVQAASTGYPVIRAAE